MTEAVLIFKAAFGKQTTQNGEGPTKYVSLRNNRKRRNLSNKKVAKP